MSAIPPGVDPNVTPAGKSPDGVYNLENPYSRAYQYYAVAAVLTALMTVFLIARLWIRFLITRTQWWDDLTIVLAFLCQIAYTALAIKQGLLGLGVHAWNMTITQELRFFKYAIPLAVMTEPAIYFTKLTLLLLYLRLFKPNKLVYIGIWTGIAVISVFYPVAMFLFIFEKDVAKLGSLNYAVAIFNVISDIYIILLPLLAVSKLHLRTAKKLRILAVFLTGTLAVVMSIVGCAFRYTFALNDNTWTLLPIYIVNTVEVDIGIICACLPLMAALFTKDKKEQWWASTFRSIRERLFSRRSSAGSHGSARSYRSTSSKRSGYSKHITPESTDNVELHPMPNQPGQDGILRQTKIEQEVV